MLHFAPQHRCATGVRLSPSRATSDEDGGDAPQARGDPSEREWALGGGGGGQVWANKLHALDGESSVLRKNSSDLNSDVHEHYFTKTLKTDF